MESIGPVSAYPPNNFCNILNFNETKRACERHKPGMPMRYIMRCNHRKSVGCVGTDPALNMIEQRYAGVTRLPKGQCLFPGAPQYLIEATQACCLGVRRRILLLHHQIDD
jgi:hypothetical protein